MGCLKQPGPVGPTGPQGATGTNHNGTNIQLTDGFYTNDQVLNSNKTCLVLNGGVFGPYEIASEKPLPSLVVQHLLFCDT